ncbi:MAG: succinate dehydrogenase, cytochrome b556 subunit [Hyphomicrobiaceae bacterium]|nr:succinate dehydrogenase, cytochrome b556 subunit [Hyphomicrobiaceae bacterium]
MAEAKSTRGARIERPLSPHLQIYSPLINMTMSILHRITGAALYFGSLLLAWWLVAAASGPGYFAFVNDIMGSLLGRLVLLGFTWALINHALGGIRHFIWDTGRGFDLKTIDLLSWGTALLGIATTLAIWAFTGQLGILVAKATALFH